MFSFAVELEDFSIFHERSVLKKDQILAYWLVVMEKA